MPLNYFMRFKEFKLIARRKFRTVKYQDYNLLDKRQT